MYHINVQSIRNKISSLELFLDKFRCSIVTINEHWLHYDESMLYIPAGYTLASIFCRDAPLTHGGCSIFVKIGIEYKVFDVVKFCNAKVFEVTAILLVSVNVIIINVYRTPDSDVNVFFSLLEDLLNHVFKHSYSIIISGDFNIDIKKQTNDSTSFLNLLRSFNLYCLNKHSTRNNACLDNIITNKPQGNYLCDVIEPNISDHSGVLAVFNEEVVSNKNVIYRTIRNLTPVAITLFKEKLNHIDWSYLLTFTNVDEAFDYFFEVVNQCFDTFCEKKEIKISTLKKRGQVKWFTPELKNMRDAVMVIYMIGL